MKTTFAVKNGLQLTEARKMCLKIVEFLGSDSSVFLVDGLRRSQLECLVNQFLRLDKKEKLQRKSGALGASFGKLGGRPRKIKTLEE